MKHSAAMVMMKSLRQPSQFPRIDMPSNPSEFPSPRFGRLDPPASGSMQQILSGIANIAKRAYPIILVLAVFLCFFLATAAIRLGIWAAAFRH
jgi:predicted RND superfamily exporter protein